jgi:hypothetical protein
LRDVDDLTDLIQVGLGDGGSLLGGGGLRVHVGDPAPAQRNAVGDTGLEQLDLVGERVDLDLGKDLPERRRAEGLEGPVGVGDAASQPGEEMLPDLDEEPSARIARAAYHRHRVGLASGVGHRLRLPRRMSSISSPI